MTHNKQTLQTSTQVLTPVSTVTGFTIQEISGTGASYLLDEIPDKPKTLYICGNQGLLNNPNLKYLCIIGSRKYTDYGKQACVELIRSLASIVPDKSVVIVSGLALGIDGIAHQTALEVGLPCIAVPGSGLDASVLYPRTHYFLAEDIVKNGGALVSEYSPLTRASPWSFPMRNRIMAGLSHAVLIIEGEKDSGTLITAKLALEYNRDVLALPGSIFSINSEGPLSLIKRGAIPITSGEDIAEALGLKGQLSLLGETKGVKGSALPQRVIDSFKYMSNEESRVIKTLTGGALSKDILFEKINAKSASDEVVKSVPFNRFQVALSMLEIKEFIIESYGELKLTDLAKQLLLCNTTSNEEK